MLSPTNFNDKAGRKAMRIRNRGLAPLGFLASAVCRERAYWLIITTQTGDGDSVFRVPASWLYFFISVLLGKGLTMLLLQEAQLAPELQPKDYTAFPLFSLPAASTCTEAQTRLALNPVLSLKPRGSKERLPYLPCLRRFQCIWITTGAWLWEPFLISARLQTEGWARRSRENANTYYTQRQAQPWVKSCSGFQTPIRIWRDCFSGLRTSLEKRSNISNTIKSREWRWLFAIFSGLEWEKNKLSTKDSTR